jgi:hypothetical protein
VVVILLLCLLLDREWTELLVYQRVEIQRGVDATIEVRWVGRRSLRRMLMRIQMNILRIAQVVVAVVTLLEKYHLEYWDSCWAWDIREGTDSSREAAYHRC